MKEVNKNNNLEKNFWFLIGNKRDLESQRKVQFNEGEKFAQKYGMKFFETSVKNGQNVKNAFEDLTKEIISEYSIEKYDENIQKNEKKSNANKKDKKTCNLF